MKKSILLLFYLCITIAINAQSIGGNVLGVSFKSSLLETFNLLNYKGYCPKMVSLPAGHSIHYMIEVQNPPEYFLNWEECVIDSYVDNFWGRTNVWDVQLMKLYKDKSIADNDYAKLLMSLKPLYHINSFLLVLNYLHLHLIYFVELNQQNFHLSLRMYLLRNPKNHNEIFEQSYF